MNKTKENNKRGMKPLKQKCEVKLNDFVRYQNSLSNRIIQISMRLCYCTIHTNKAEVFKLGLMRLITQIATRITIKVVSFTEEQKRLNSLILL